MSTLERALRTVTVNSISCTVDDDEFKKHVPKEHMGQITQQMIVLSLNHNSYLCAAEVGLMYVAVVYCPPGVIDICNHALKISVEPLYREPRRRTGASPRLPTVKQRK